MLETRPVSSTGSALIVALVRLDEMRLDALRYFRYIAALKGAPPGGFAGEPAKTTRGSTTLHPDRPTCVKVRSRVSSEMAVSGS